MELGKHRMEELAILDLSILPQEQRGQEQLVSHDYQQRMVQLDAPEGFLLRPQVHVQYAGGIHDFHLGTGSKVLTHFPINSTSAIFESRFPDPLELVIGMPNLPQSARSVGTRILLPMLLVVLAVCTLNCARSSSALVGGSSCARRCCLAFLDREGAVSPALSSFYNTRESICKGVQVLSWTYL